MKYGKKNVVSLLAVFLLGSFQGVMAQERIEVHPTAWTQLALKGADKDLASKIAAQITANPKDAAVLVKALVAANPEHAAAIVSSAIVTLDVGLITSGIVAAAVSAAPSQAAAITSAAVAAAPSQAVTITVAALESVQNRNQAPAIINSALQGAPKDSKTVAELQSLSTRNWTPQDNALQNFSQSRQNLQQIDKTSPPSVMPAPVEIRGGGASPS